MEERKFIQLKKDEFGIKEYIKRNLGKGKISKLTIEYTPVGEKIIIETDKPGVVIGKRGEKIEELTRTLKTKFKLENPNIEIKEIENSLFDAQLVADQIALDLEKMGNLKFKVIAYKKLQQIINAGALGCEIRLSGKLPGDRARPWRFAHGYLKKTGDSAKEVDRAQSTALTKTGVIGIKVAIMAPTAKIYDKMDIDEEMIKKTKENIERMNEENKPKLKKVMSKTKKIKIDNQKTENKIKKINKKELSKKTEEVEVAQSEEINENTKTQSNKKTQIKKGQKSKSKEIKDNDLEDIDKNKQGADE